MFFNLLKGPDPSYPVFKFGDDLSSRNRDMAQNVILHICDLERSRSSVRSTIFCTEIRTLPMSKHVRFHRHPNGSFSGKLAQNLPKSGQEKERRTLWETIWRTLTLCDANYTMKERSDVKVTTHDLKIFLWTFFWHKFGLNTLSRYRDRASESLPKINANCYSKTRR